MFWLAQQLVGVAIVGFIIMIFLILLSGVGDSIKPRQRTDAERAEETRAMREMHDSYHDWHPLRDFWKWVRK